MVEAIVFEFWVAFLAFGEVASHIGVLALTRCAPDVVVGGEGFELMSEEQDKDWAASDAGVMDGEMEGEVEMITKVVADCDA